VAEQRCRLFSKRFRGNSSQSIPCQCVLKKLTVRQSSDRNLRNLRIIPSWVGNLCGLAPGGLGCSFLVQMFRCDPLI
jgi:hypothetical protein